MGRGRWEPGGWQSGPGVSVFLSLAAVVAAPGWQSFLPGLAPAHSSEGAGGGPALCPLGFWSCWALSSLVLDVPSVREAKTIPRHL